MRKDEANLWQRIHSNLPRVNSRIRLERVEAMINDGIPDLHCIVNGRVSWIELKSVPGLPTKPFAPVLAKPYQKLSQDQRNWHMDYQRCGGRVATLIGIGSYDYVLMGGRHSDGVSEMSWDLMKKSAIICAPRELFFASLSDWLEGIIS